MDASASVARAGGTEEKLPPPVDRAAALTIPAAASPARFKTSVLETGRQDDGFDDGDSAVEHMEVVMVLVVDDCAEKAGVNPMPPTCFIAV